MSIVHVGLVAVWLAAASGDAMSRGSSYDVASWVVGTGGGASAAAEYRVVGTAGQPAVSASIGGDYAMSSGYWWISGLGGTTPIDPDLPGGGGPGSVPQHLVIGPLAPNPASGIVTFRLALPAPARVERQFFDVGGRWLHTIDSGVLPVGIHGLTWDGVDSAGRRVGSGIYYERLFLDGRQISKRSIVVVR